MAAGIRLYHPTVRSKTGVFEFPKLRLRQIRVKGKVIPQICGACGIPHRVKTMHFAVDANGFAFVSHEIWELMKRYNEFGGFELANEVATPPNQTVGMLPTVIDIVRTDGKD